MNASNRWAGLQVDKRDPLPEDTVVTPALQNAAKNWRSWAMPAGSVVVAACSLIYAFGGKHEHSVNMENNYVKDHAQYLVDQADSKKQLERIEAKVDALSPLPEQVKYINDRQTRMEDNWDFATQQAGVNPRPGHRAHKP